MKEVNTMFNEAIFNALNIGLAAWVVWKGMNIKKGAAKTVGMYIVIAGAILGGAELIDMFQIFPDGSLLANLMYEKEIPVLVMLVLALQSLKGKGK